MSIGRVRVRIQVRIKVKLVMVRIKIRIRLLFLFLHFYTFAFCILYRKVFQIGTVRYNWPMSAHASQAFSIAHCTDSEDLPLYLPSHPRLL